MYILSLDYSCHSDSWYNYVVDIPINAANLLTDEEFLKEFDWLFENGITGYRIELESEKTDTWKMIVQFSNWDNEFEETEFYLIKVNFVNSHGIHRGE